MADMQLVTMIDDTAQDNSKRKPNEEEFCRLKIGATKTYKMLKEHVNGFENIGASLNDFKNFHRNVKCYIHERDGQLFIDHFKEMAVNKEGFFFDYDVDSTWVLKRFLVAMGGKEPNYIITDQDAGILKAVPLVFKKARHRFCMWHIMNKVPTKYGVTREDYIVFIRKINTIIWDEDIEAAEFDARWEEIGEEHGLNNIDWFKEMFSKRNQWVMAHCGPRDGSHYEDDPKIVRVKIVF
ncbi:protein FAR1-RELATED SEQUENCE 1-like [Silene latifolia]|uniref:protein FAR1-RELATED SEQUENCE 1-like n=1 Tax=Silene latifolia TaxID=37657 RepID=UPI003D77A220